MGSVENFFAAGIDTIEAFFGAGAGSLNDILDLIGDGGHTNA